MHEGKQYLDSLSSRGAYKYAEENNLDIVLAGDNELQIDLDTESQYELYQKQLIIFLRYFSVEKIIEQPSRHGLPKKHITITLPDSIDDVLRIAFQACLGSDPIRELLCIARILVAKEKHPTLFFEQRENNAQGL